MVRGKRAPWCRVYRKWSSETGVVFVSTRVQDKPFGLACFSYRSLSIWCIYLRSLVFPLLNPSCFWNKYQQKKGEKKKKQPNTSLEEPVFSWISSYESHPLNLLPLPGLGCGALDFSLGLPSFCFFSCLLHLSFMPL